MRIAVTGGTGLLGRYFLKCLSEHGLYNPIILSRGNTYFNNGVEVRKTDYSFPSLIEVLKDVDAVVHLAALRGNFKNLRDYHVNTDITENLYKACSYNKIYNIVYASSISVYSQEILLPWSEIQPPTPYSLYGISKLNCEYLGDYYSNQYGLYVKNLRFAHLFGYNEQNDYMINKFMRQAFQKERLVLFSRCTAKREFLYGKDAARAILLAVKAQKLGGTFNVGSGEALTNLMVAENINQAFNNGGNILVKELEGKSIVSSYMTSEKVSTELGFKSEYSFTEAMKDIYEEMKNV